VKIVIGALVVLGAVMVPVALYWLHRTMSHGADQRRAKRRFVEREQERDRRACIEAAESMAGGSAPPGDSDVRSAPVDGAGRARTGGGPPAGQSLEDAIDSRRRAATSTSFDPDLPRP
jgi:hypothetical protein